MNSNKLINISDLSILPYELQDKIMKIYWKNSFKKQVINECNTINYDLLKIYNYMIKHGMPNIKLGAKNGLVRQHYFYYLNHNNLLKNIWKNKALILLSSKLLNFQLFQYDLYSSSTLFDNIDYCYKNIVIFYMLKTNTGVDHYMILNYFREISIQKFNG